MNQITFNTRKAVAALIVVASFAFSASQARAEESSPGQTVPASDVAPRPIMIKTMVAGGLRNGSVMMIEAGKAEVFTPAQYAKGLTLAQKSGTGSDTCLMF